MTEHTIALLVAGGGSRRMQAELPKPYLQLGGETLLRRAVRTFQEHPAINGVRVVIRREHHALYKKAVDGLTLFPCVIGGEQRQDSVRAGLESIAHREPKYVLVHDVARPLAGPGLISRVLEALKDSSAAIPAIAVTDTIKRADNGLVRETVSRDHLFAVQTPQGYHFETLLAAHRRFAGEALTDDAQLIEKLGEEVAVVSGEPDNMKITTMEDLKRMQAQLSLSMDTRTGLGYDVHTLKAHDSDTPVPQQTIKLCGIKIPYTHHLEGHSDADVGLHALVDAILATISAGDIGTHFPPDDRKWQGANSDRFLLHAYELLTARGGELVHLDVTLICEKPKIAPHREEMRHHIAQILKLPVERVSVKATTSEKLGFTGRGEGIAAQALATVRLPKV